MEDVVSDLSSLPDDLRRYIIDYRRAREIGLRELVESRNASFFEDVEAEMWALLTLPGRVQPGLILAVLNVVLSKQLRAHARLIVREANALRVADYKETTRQQEADIRRMYLLSLRARQRNEEELAGLID